MRCPRRESGRALRCVATVSLATLNVVMRRTRPGRATRVARRRRAPCHAVARLAAISPIVRAPSMASNSRFSLRVDRQVDVAVGVGPVDQHRRRAGRQPLLDADRVGHANRHVAEPGVTGKADRWRRRGCRRGTRSRCGEPSCRETARRRHTVRRAEAAPAAQPAGCCAMTPQCGL